MNTSTVRQAQKHVTIQEEESSTRALLLFYTAVQNYSRTALALGLSKKCSNKVNFVKSRPRSVIEKYIFPLHSFVEIWHFCHLALILQL